MTLKLAGACASPSPPLMVPFLIRLLLSCFLLLIFPPFFFVLVFGRDSIFVSLLGFFIPLVLAVIAWRCSNPFQLSGWISTRHAHKSRLIRYFYFVGDNYVNTIYQNLLILVSFGTYVVACYWLQYDDEGIEGRDLVYHLEQSTQLTFEMTECFFAVSFGLDLFFRAMCSSETHDVHLSARESSLARVANTKPASFSPFAKLRKFLTSYILIDSLAFASFLCTAQMAPRSFTRVHYYNFYLISGIFRILRLRRTLKALDIYEQRRNIVARFRKKKYVLLSWRQAGTIVLGTPCCEIFVC